jgi:hypothetical protein
MPSVLAGVSLGTADIADAAVAVVEVVKQRHILIQDAEALKRLVNPQVCH